MRTIQDVTKNIPQPWRAYVARSLMVVVIPIAFVVAAVVEGSGWLKKISEEVVDAWKDCTTWR